MGIKGKLRCAVIYMGDVSAPSIPLSQRQVFVTICTWCGRKVIRLATLCTN